MAAYSSFSKGFVWVLDLFPFSGAVPFFALSVHHEAGTATYRRLSLRLGVNSCETKLEYYQVIYYYI